MRQELEEYIERKGCRVRLQGRSANIASQMKSAQVFVLSSDYEGMSNAMIEAMYLGLPVISTKVSGAKELIIDHINGCFADDANSIAQAFSYLSENETAAREIGLRASNTIKQLSRQKYRFAAVDGHNRKIYKTLITMNYPVAVIIPVYKNDTPQYVRPAIDSIIKQTYSCRIYIGVDGPIGNSLNSCLEAYEITKRIDCNVLQRIGDSPAS